MSRSPLFRLIKRSLLLADQAHFTGRPASEVVDRWRRQQLTRRQFLRATTAAAGMTFAGCSGLRRIAGLPGGAPEVVVVGAGLAGLTVAYRLQQAGVAVRVVEALNRLGGRVRTLHSFFPDGQVVDLGGELIGSGHRNILKLVHELGLSVDDLSADGSELEPSVWYFHGRRLQDQEIVEGFRPIVERIRHDLKRLHGGRSISYRASHGAEFLDRQSLVEWIESVDADSWMRDLVTIGYTAECGLEAAEQSALNLLMLIDLGSETPGIFGESDERFRVHGGTDRLIEALAAPLRSKIDTGTRLEAVRKLADGNFECSLRRDSSSSLLVAPHLVLTLPFTLLRKVRLDFELPPAKRRAIETLGYGSNSKLMVGFSERVWRTLYKSHGSVATDLGFQTTWEASRLQPGVSGVLTNFTGGEHGLDVGRGTAAHQAELLVAGLERIFPGLAAYREDMKETRFHWPSHPYSRGSYSCYKKGQWTSISGVESERVGNLHFAGEHCSVEYQGYLEGACVTGEAVARRLLAELRPRPEMAAATLRR